MPRIALGLEYDGAHFSGWQSQLDRQTVQNTLELALTKFASESTCEPIKVIVAGRTDTGVHALGQIVHFDTSIEREAFKWVRGVNAFLPPFVTVQWAQSVDTDFHARFSAIERTYDYIVYINSIRPTLLNKRVGWFYKPLDITAMQESIACLTGEHDFSSFRSSQCQSKTPIKHLKNIEIKQALPFIYFRFTANAFLHHMVRNLMGCFVEIGRKSHPADWIKEILEKRNRCLAAPTFMPDGLYLTRIHYPKPYLFPQLNDEDLKAFYGIHYS